jgi:hypothetical protein
MHEQMPASGLIAQKRPFVADKPAQRRMETVPAAAAGDAPAPEPKKILGYDVLTWQKIIPLGAMFFCILFNYTILRDTKVGATPLNPRLLSSADVTVVRIMFDCAYYPPSDLRFGDHRPSSVCDPPTIARCAGRVGGDRARLRR